MANPISVALPADLPENWQTGQTVAPQGSDVGLTERHGYNYLMKQVNAAQTAAAQLGASFGSPGGAATLDEEGRLTQSQLPDLDAGQITGLEEAMSGKQDVVTGGASSITSANLTASRALVSNSSGKVAVSAVTATELGYLDGVTSGIQTQLNGKAASSHNHSAANITSGTLSVSRGGTGVTSLAALAAALAGEGSGRMEFGSYVGTGTGGVDAPTKLTFSFPPKLVYIGHRDDPEEYMISFSGSGQAITQYDTMRKADLVWSGNTLSLTSSLDGSDRVAIQMNWEGETYQYAAFG